MSRDTIGDFLTSIRNGVMAARPFVRAPYSKLAHELAKILKNEGFIHDVLVEEHEQHEPGFKRGFKGLKIILKYTRGESVIHEIKRISTPGRRIYEGIATLKPLSGGLGIAIVTTNQGVMTSRQALQRSLGGEVMCTVW